MMTAHTMKIIIVALLAFVSFAGQSQEENRSKLELSLIMKGQDFIGYSPTNIRWSISGEHILFDWNPNLDPGSSPYSYQLSRGITEPLSPDFYDMNGDYSVSMVETKDYYLHQGALYHYDRSSKKPKLIYGSSNGLRELQYVHGTNRLIFREGNEVKEYDIASKSLRSIFEFKSGDEPSEKKNETHLSRQEEELFQFIRDEKKENEWQQAQNEKWSTEIAKFYTGKEAVRFVRISQDGNHLLFGLYTDPNGQKTEVTHHLSKDGHAYQQAARPKVNDNDPNMRMGIYNFESDTLYFADLTTLKDIRKKPEYLKEYGDSGMEYKTDRNVFIHAPLVSHKGNIVFDIRAADNKDRWIVGLDIKSGKLEEFEHQHDEAWIGGPGISSWNMVNGTLDWFSDGESFYFQSEESGYSHLYSISTKSGKKEQLTTGKWEVYNVSKSKDGKTLFVTANKNHPGNREFYHFDIASKKLTPILTKTGAHEVDISPDEKWLAVRSSAANEPWELFLVENKPGKAMKQLTSSTTDEFKKTVWYAPEVISFKAEDGTKVNARLYSPESGVKNNAAIIFVHGAGYLQNAHNWWSSYYREYMFHNLLRDNGFTVLDIDYRASQGYGRDFRTEIYRNMGGKDLSDQVDGRQFLIDSLGIDANRIGIYGGSYGGFITLMALLKEPGKFNAGAALRSVTDWNHYNHEYTSNILNYPGTDSIAYRRSSPIYYAEGLNDKLLMLHGMVDDNVQFQDVVRLSQRFIELGKRNWELAVFPVEAHGFQKSYSWADEYRRIFELFMEELK